jgi:hypothetical protein
MTEIIVPNNWDDVTVGQYHRLQLIKEGKPFRRSLELIKILCNYEDVGSLPLAVMDEIVKELSFLSTPVPSEIIKDVYIHGQLYRWIGSFNEITTGEALSIEQIIDLEDLDYNLTHDVIAAVLLRKVLPNGELEPFDSGKFMERRELFNSIPVSKVSGMIGFFLRGGHLSTKIIGSYSVKPMSRKRTRSENWRRRLKRVIRLMQLIGG